MLDLVLLCFCCHRQLAHVVGCESRGLEILQWRNCVAVGLEEDVATAMNHFASHMEESFRCGKIELRHGDLTDLTHREWLVEADVTFVNNFNEVCSPNPT